MMVFLNCSLLEASLGRAWNINIEQPVETLPLLTGEVLARPSSLDRTVASDGDKKAEDVWRKSCP